MNLLDTKEFRIQLTGDRTGTVYFGDFSCFRRLSHRQELTRDRFYRELIGPDPQNANERVISQAEVFADLKVSILKAPQFWNESGGGLDLADDNIVRTVWEEVMKARVEAIKEMEDKGKKAEEELRKL